MKRVLLPVFALSLLFVAGCGDDNHDFFNVESVVVTSPRNGGNVTSFDICGFGQSDPIPNCPAGSGPGSLLLTSNVATGGAPEDIVFATPFNPPNDFVIDANEGTGALDLTPIVPNGSLGFSPGAPVRSFAAGAGSHGVAVTPNGSFVYAVNNVSNTVSIFSLDAANGVLNPIGSVPTGAAGSTDAGSAVITPNGQFLYVSNGSGSVSAFSVAGNGALTKVAGSPFVLPFSTPHALATDPAGNFLFVADDAGASRIFVLAIAAGGGLTNVAGSPFAVAGGNAEGLVVDKSGRFLYVGEETGVQGFAIGASGALTGGALVATGGAAEGVAIEATNQFLYVTNDDQGTVAGFSGAGSGTLAPVAGSPFATGLPALFEGGPDGITATVIRTAIP